VLIEINKKVGFRLFAKFGTKGVINLGRMIPPAQTDATTWARPEEKASEYKAGDAEQNVRQDP
jgi:hypothetical protein